MKAPGDAQIFEFEGFRLDMAARLLTGPDGVVELPSRAFDVLAFMVTRPGTVLDRNTLLEAVWPTTVVEESNLTQTVFALRRALGESADEPRFIATVPGRGYQFVGRVTASAHAAAASIVPAAPPPSARWRRTTLIGAAALLAVVALVVVLWTKRESAQRAEPAGRLVSVAVLPFSDLSASKDMDYFADGIAAELMSSLSKVHGLQIISQHSTFAFKGKNVDARSIGEQLHVESILEGAVRKDGDRIRITAQLTRTKDGVSLWTETYDRKFDDVLDVESSIAREVVAALAPVVQEAQPLTARAEPALTQNAEAYRAYLRGVYLFTRWYDHDPQPARDEFLHAVQLDPGFAKAQAMLARTYQLSASLGLGDVPREEKQAEETLDKALKLDPSIGDLWWVQLIFLKKNSLSNAAAAAVLEKTVATNPTDSEPMIWLGHQYFTLGRGADAVKMFERAHVADPLAPNPILNLVAYGVGRARYLELVDEMERLAPGDAKAYWMRSNLAFDEGRVVDWDGLVAKVIELHPNDHQAHAWLGNDYLRLGAVDAAQYHESMCRKLEPRSPTCAYWSTHVDLFAGDIAAARRTVLDAMKTDPQVSLVQLAQGELQYFAGDCAGALRSIATATPAFDRPEDSLDVFHNNEDLPMFAWCLRQRAETSRLDKTVRAWKLQIGILDARMAAAVGDRTALVTALADRAKSDNMGFEFARHEPMIQPWLEDKEVVALLDKIDARQAEWRKLLPKSSLRVPVPGIAPTGAGS